MLWVMSLCMMRWLCKKERKKSRLGVKESDGVCRCGGWMIRNVGRAMGGKNDDGGGDGYRMRGRGIWFQNSEHHLFM